MTKNEVEDLKDLIQSSERVVIIPHKNPDGDAIGSTLALNHFLNDFGLKSSVISPNEYPDFLKWMPGEDSILIFENDESKAQNLINEAELIFTLDFNSLSRIDKMGVLVEKSKATKVMIDHHQSPDDYADFMYSDDSMSSTCEMVYNFIAMVGSTNKINKKIANCLYAGIVTDTGSFRFPSTTSMTHKVVSELIDRGADNSQIHNNIYDTNSYNKLQLLGKALINLKVLPDYRTAYITLSQDELNEYEFRKGDTEGFVNYGLSLKGVIFAVIFIENQQEDIVKISLRSKGDFSVNDFARNHYEGGGHNNAAGGKSRLSLEKTVEEFISILPNYKNALNQ